MVKILGAFTATDAGSIPGWGVRIPQIMSHSQKNKKKIKTKQYKSFPLINTIKTLKLTVSFISSHNLCQK